MLLQLFLTFFYIGAFSFGGGYAMLPLIQEEIVYSKGWLSAHQFADIIAVSQMTPGPVSLNTATYVGYKTAGVLGSALATSGLILPSLIIILTLTRLVLKNKDNPYFQGIFSGLRPIVVALIIGAAYLVGIETIKTFTGLGLFFLALGIMLFTKFHPILIIFGFGLIGIFFSSYL